MPRKYYVPLELAKKELTKRIALKKAVEEWWFRKCKAVPPDIELFDFPTAVFLRQLATCRYEDIVFCLLARKAGLLPLWLEYTGDKMVAKSNLKRTYLRRQICWGRGRNGGFKPFSIHRLADIPASCGKRLNEIETSEDLLPEVHRCLQEQVIPGARRRDLTLWYSKIPKEKRYDAMLSLGVAHGVLFEDYHSGESGDELKNLRRDVFEPAWKRVASLFGAKPLMVKMPWKPEFAWYPADGSWHTHGIVPEELLEWRW